MNRLSFPSWVASTLICAALLAIDGAKAEQTASQTSQEQTTVVEFTPLQTAVKVALDGQLGKAKDSVDKKRRVSIGKFYESRDFQPVWVENNVLGERGKAIIEKLSHAAEHALDPAEYDLDVLAAAADFSDPKKAAEFDVVLSHALVAYGQHLNAGRINPTSVNRENVIYPDAISPEHILQQASSTGSIVAYLRLLAPRTPRYERLRIALQNYRDLARAGGWEMIAEGEVLKPGMEDDRVPALRKRLYQSGDYQGDVNNPSTLYDGDIIDAVINFQNAPWA